MAGACATRGWDRYIQGFGVDTGRKGATGKTFGADTGRKGATGKIFGADTGRKGATWKTNLNYSSRLNRVEESRAASRVMWQPERVLLHLEDLGIGGRRIILKQTLEWEGTDRIYLADDGDRWQALVNALMNLGDPQNAGNCMTEGL